MEYINLILSALSQGMIYAPMALGVYIAFSILDTADLTVDGSFVFAMAICGMVTVAGHPYLAIVAGVLAGAAAGFITGILQTKMKINEILAGILTMTALYTINFLSLGGQANLYLQSPVKNANGVETFVASKTLYKSFVLFMKNNAGITSSVSSLILSILLVAFTVVILAVFFKTRPGIAIRATGDNEEMVRSSSINADTSRIIGIMIANALVGLSGSMLCQQQRYADLNCGTGMLVVGLASVIIGQVIFGKRSVTIGVISAVAGSCVYRLILQAAYKVDMPSYAVKLLSALIVVIALTAPIAKKKLSERRMYKANEKEEAA